MLLCLTGCFKSDSYEGINIYTTLYPIEYITKTLYGEYATINSIYPNGVDIENYTITNKKLKIPGSGFTHYLDRGKLLNDQFLKTGL